MASTEALDAELDKLTRRIDQLNQDETISFTYEVYAPAWPKKARRFILATIPRDKGWTTNEFGTTLREYQPFVQYLNGVIDALDIVRVRGWTSAKTLLTTGLRRV